MNWKPILIRKAARARQQFNTACWGIILLALAIVYKVWQEGDWGPISPDGENGFLWLAGGMLVSAWLLVLVDCFLRPEESPPRHPAVQNPSLGVSVRLGRNHCGVYVGKAFFLLAASVWFVVGVRLRLSRLTQGVLFSGTSARPKKHFIRFAD